MRCANVSTTLGEYTREKSSAGSVCTMAGTLSRSKPRPVTGVVATTWNAGIWDAGVGADAGEGAGAATRAGRAARAGLAAGAARRTGAGRGAATVTSGSVAATCPRAAPIPVKAPDDASAPSAAACNKRRFAAASRDASRPYPPAPRIGTDRRIPSDSGTSASSRSHDVLPIRIGNIWQCGRRDTGYERPSPRTSSRLPGDITGEAVSELKKAPRASASELAAHPAYG